MVADPALNPNIGAISGGRKRRQDQVGLIVVQYVEAGGAQAGESLVPRFIDRRPRCELIVSDRIDGRRRSKRVKDNRDTAGGAPGGPMALLLKFSALLNSDVSRV